MPPSFCHGGRKSSTPMDSDVAAALARATLYLHFFVVVFNIGGLILIPLGKIFAWSFVRIFWWRALHAISMACVAVQAAFGQYCFLTTIEYYFRYEAGAYIPPTALDEWIAVAVFWPLPFWVFVPLYLMALGLTVWFWFWARPAREKYDIGRA